MAARVLIHRPLCTDLISTSPTALTVLWRYGNVKLRGPNNPHPYHRSFQFPLRLECVGLAITAGARCRAREQRIFSRVPGLAAGLGFLVPAVLVGTKKELAPGANQSQLKRSFCGGTKLR